MKYDLYWLRSYGKSYLIGQTSGSMSLCQKQAAGGDVTGLQSDNKYYYTSYNLLIMVHNPAHGLFSIGNSLVSCEGCGLLRSS